MRAGIARIDTRRRAFLAPRMGPVRHDRDGAERFRRIRLAAAVCRLSVAAALAAAAMPGGIAAALADCAPLARPPGFRPAQDAERRAYDAIEFTVLHDGRPAAQTVAGATCYQVYLAEDGAATPGVTALLARYRERLAETSARILFADRARIHARLSRAGRETWFRIDVQDNEIDVTVLHRQPLKPSLTRPSGRDHRLIGHMPHYQDAAVDKHADAVRRFTVQGRSERSTVEVSGAVTEVTYRAKARNRLSSDVEIQENYRVALRARGADILFTDWRTTVARIAERDRVTWLRVTSQVSEIAVLAVEVKLPAPEKRPSDAALIAALAPDGRAMLVSGLGVGAAAPARADRGIVAQVVRLMRRDRALTLAVVAHTDNLGDRAANLERSQAQAEAIAAAVVKQGIARGRIGAIGAGPDRPVADNATVQGRAANRRIELVRDATRRPSGQ